MKVLRPLSELISLNGKRVLITGSAVGIGRAMAVRFAEAGADLQLVDINVRRLGAVKKELTRFKSKIDTYQTDISKKEEIDFLWAELRGVEPDVLINNAGVYPFKNFHPPYLGQPEVQQHHIYTIPCENINSLLPILNKYLNPTSITNRHNIRVVAPDTQRC